MRFERNRDPRHSMDVGAIATAPIICRLLWDSQLSETGHPGEHVVRVPDMDVPGCLERLENKLDHYYLDFKSKDGKIFSGIDPIGNYAGKHVQYEGKLYLIPKA